MSNTKPVREKWFRLKGEKEIQLVKDALKNHRTLKAAGMPRHTENRNKQREEIIEELTTLENLEKQLI